MELFTIGHSNHTSDCFIDLLAHHEITAIADVRSSPFSRRFSHFNQSFLKQTLSSAEIAYVFLGDMLGARPKDPRCYENGKARYELITATDTFAQGLKRVLDGSKRYRIALLCAEQDPITCHRAILVCKNLKRPELAINHILKNGDLETHDHLERRLLKLHNLDAGLSAMDAEIGSEKTNEVQLQLFDASYLNPCPAAQDIDKSPTYQELVEQAYKLQGERLAYVEQQTEGDFQHERVS